jgi:NADP-dependent 3-hydroxy acid dehydrogenase YdfG
MGPTSNAMFDLNVKGLFSASQAAARVMIRQCSGTIINRSSQAGFIVLPVSMS